MTIESTPFGMLPDGSEVEKFILKNSHGIRVEIINYGAIITSIIVPDKHREPGDVVLGFETLEEYLSDHPYFGAMVGRCCNRIGGAAFTLEGKRYELTANEGGNHIHGGARGFDKVLWTASYEQQLEDVSLTLTYHSPDGEEGYPGNLMVEVVYALNDQNELSVSMRASTDKTTHVNLTNHSYFNLNSCKGNIHKHELFIDSEKYTALDSDSIPTGHLLDVKGTPYDFRLAKPIGKGIARVGMGYDINYAINKHPGELSKVAALHDPDSGRTLEVLTTQPGLQLYTANYVDKIKGKGGQVYGKHSAVCLETQHFPDAANKPYFPSTVVHPDEDYNETAIFRFVT